MQDDPLETILLNQPLLDVPGTRDIPTRREMDDIAAKVGLDFLVNTVLDDDEARLSQAEASCSFCIGTVIFNLKLLS